MSVVCLDRWLIICAVFSASSVFRFSCASISWGELVMILCGNFSRVCLICFRFVGAKSFESFAPKDLISDSWDGSIRTPARTIGPITGPRPASSIPRSFIY